MVYQTAIITDEVSQNLEVAVDFALRHHLDGLEIRSVEEKNPFQMTREDYLLVRRTADEHGLSVCAIGAPLFKSTLGNAEETRLQIEGLKRAIEGAHILGTSLVRGFTFWKSEDENVLERAAEAYLPVLPLLESEGITLALESDPGVNTYNMERLAAFLQTLNHPNVGALYDPGNEICDPDAPPPFPVGYRRLKPWIRHIHIKDLKWTGTQFAPAKMGEGDVDFHGLFRQLDQDGYQGWLSVETHWRIKTELDEELMKKPQGSGFSDGGLEASEVYLDILRREYGFGGR